MKSRSLVLALILGLFAWFFAAALFRSGLFAFRDAADFYPPLFQLTRSQWLSGLVPLWNPYENLGMPLAGNGTSSVFYPGTLIFLLPCDFAWTCKIYVMAHVLLAAVTAYREARQLGSSVEAAGLCRLCYAFGGNVLFQYTNVVFLVGAAWLPAAVEATDRMLLGRSFSAAAGLGVILALMTLGGDPQAAYHAGLLAATYALGLWWCERRTGRAAISMPLIRTRPALLAVAAGVGLALATVVILPSAEFAARSERGHARGAEHLRDSRLFASPGRRHSHRSRTGSAGRSRQPRGTRLSIQRPPVAAGGVFLAECRRPAVSRESTLARRRALGGTNLGPFFLHGPVAAHLGSGSFSAVSCLFRTRKRDRG